MQYNISINQRAIIESGLQLTFDDAAILDFIRSFSHSNAITKLQLNGKTYYWFSYKKVIEELPMLSIKKDRVYRKFKQFADLGLLEQHPDNVQLGRSYYAITDRFLGLFHGTTDNSTAPYGEKADPPTVKTPSDHNTSDHLTISDNTPHTPQGEKEGSSTPDHKNDRNANALGMPADVEVRMVKFKTEIVDVGGTIYTKLMLERFYDYWTELDRGKQPKMRFEKQKAFEVKKRLNKWATNNLDKIECYLKGDDKTVADKRRAFADTLKSYEGRYTREFLLEFYRHWSQPENKQDPKLLRFEKEAFWDLATRLAAWKDRQQPQTNR